MSVAASAAEVWRVSHRPGRSFLRTASPSPASRTPASSVPVAVNPVIGSCPAVLVDDDAVVDVGVVDVGVVDVGVVVVGVVVVGVVVVGVVDVAFARTTTVPCMNGWIEQIYVNVPAVVNVCDALWPFWSTPVLKLPLLAVAVCALGPSLVQVTVSPT